MLDAKVGKKGEHPLFQLVGDVDDAADFDKIMGAGVQSAKEVHVDCSRVDRINSVGVKGWIKFFRALQTRNVPVFFWDCAPPIVQQMNLVFNFACGAKVMSVQATFSCDSCDSSFRKTLAVPELISWAFKVPSQTCVKCSKPASLEDMPNIYFKFLMASAKAQEPKKTV
jgi:anti-anti-sigma regulatory factor